MARRDDDRDGRRRRDGRFRVARDPGGRVLIAITFDRDSVAAGEFLTGRVHWAGERAKELFVIAEWRTDGQGNRAHGLVRAARFPVAGSEGTFPFRFLIPYEGPVSFEGEMVSVTWHLRVHVDQPGLDESGERDFRVVVR